MTRATTTTRATVRAYHQARFRGDIPAAVRTLAEPFHFQSPLLTSDSPHHHLSGLDAFLGIVSGVDLISELYGESEAILLYDVHTSVSAIGTQRTAEHFHLTDGRIDTIRLIFDATAWHAVMRAVTPP
ncbi:hypothetical protein ACFW5D_36415 [Streptomyces sp. NPDC058770]|uniref:hypothetical protein n=1 Tax=Streptomyces sp. NPDC058770 TaxID=3346631 RepID=UPI0036AA9804